MFKRNSVKIILIVLACTFVGLIIYKLVIDSGNNSTLVNSGKVEEPKSNISNNSPKSTTSTGSSNSNTSAASSTLIAPSGEFVSNHKPSMSYGGEEESVCNTTPGANCQINFTQGSVSKSLSSQTTNSSGSAIWTWSLSDVGLSTGNWQVSAVSSLNGQTKTTTDPIMLQISQ